MMDQLIADLKLASSGLLNQAMIDRGSGWIESLKADYPLAHRLLIGVLYKEPSEVLDALCKMQPHLREHLSNGRGWNDSALAYVTALQKRLRGEDKPKPAKRIRRSVKLLNK